MCDRKLTGVPHTAWYDMMVP